MYVRRTQQLVNDLIAKMEKMHRHEVSQVTSSTVEIGSPVHTAMRNAVEVALWEGYEDLKDRMPDKWCRMNDSQTVSFTTDTNGVRDFTEVRLSFPDNNKLKCPPNHDYYRGIQIPLAKTDETIRNWVAQSAQREEQRRLITDRYNTMRNQLVAFVEQHASLNAALKAMPELEFYIPQTYLDKVNETAEPRERVKKETLVEEMKIDVDALTSMAVAHRIATAGL